MYIDQLIMFVNVYVELRSAPPYIVLCQAPPWPEPDMGWWAGLALCTDNRHHNNNNTTGEKGLDDDLQDSKLFAKCISAIED